WVLRRAINANLRVGEPGNADALARFAASAEKNEVLRVEALTCLSDWPDPSPLDRIVGLFRPLPARPADVAAAAFRAHMAGIFGSSDRLRAEAAKVAAKLCVQEASRVLAEAAADGNGPASVRVEMLKALAALKPGGLRDAVQHALTDADPLVRTEGRRILADLEPHAVLDQLKTALDKGGTIDRQGAFAIL